MPDANDFTALIDRYKPEHNWSIIKQPIHLDDYQQHAWVVCNPPHTLDQDGGWKLHVSATVADATKILEVVLPILFHFNVHFKFADSTAFLARLNSEKSDLRQVGKFITIYPRSETQALILAGWLHEKTKHLTGPKILSDCPVAPNSRVHFRFGAFRSSKTQTLGGEITDIIKLKDNYILDRRTLSYCDPKNLPNPFGVNINAKKYLKDRYFPAYNITKSHRGEVYLAVDIHTRSRCIIKLARNNSLHISDERNAHMYLQREKETLQQLSDINIAPKLLDNFIDEENNSVLIQEDISMRTLEETIMSYQTQAKRPSRQAFLACALSMAETIHSLHHLGYIHCDLKTTNILYDQSSNTTKLIDFESAYKPGYTQDYFAVGTMGFSIDELNHQVPTVAKDIYSFGATLFYLLAANSTPFLVNLSQQKILELLEFIAPEQDMDLKQLVIQCLNVSSTGFNSFAQIVKQIKQLQREQPQHSKPKPVTTLSCLQVREHAKKVVAKMQQRLTESQYIPEMIDTTPLHDMRGTAGIIIALCEYYQTFNDLAVIPTIQELLNTIVTSLNNDFHYRIPGLFVGHGGLCLALLRAGIALNDQSLLRLAQREYIHLEAFAHESMDLMNGSAGRLKLAIHFYQHFKCTDYLKDIELIAEEICQQAIFSSKDQCYWVVPDYDSIPGNATFEDQHVYVGYAHGVAGIADSLVDAYRVLNQPPSQIKTTINAAANWVESQRSLHSSLRLSVWPRHPGEATSQPYWCHGGGGIAKFLLNFAKTFNDTRFNDFALDAAHHISKHYRNNTPGYCHGLISDIDTLIDIYQFSGDETFYQYALDVTALLNFWLNEVDEAVLKHARVSNMSLLNGIPGMLLAYARIHNTAAKGLFECS